MNIPPSVGYFSVALVALIVYGLHLAHIDSIGFHDYTKEVLKKNFCDYDTAKKIAKQTIWWCIGVVCASLLAIVYMMLQYFITYIKPNL